jgi:hypothetical protein
MQQDIPDPTPRYKLWKMNTQIPAPKPHPMQVPTPKIISKLLHFIPPDMPYLISHIKELFGKQLWTQQ